MKRRAFMAQAGAALTGAALASLVPAWAQTSPDVKLEIAPLELEIAPRQAGAYRGLQRARSRPADSLA